MKKIIALLLTIVLAFTTVACINKSVTPSDKEDTEKTAEATDNTTDPENESYDEETAVDESDTPAANTATVGKALAAEFKAAVQSDSSLTAEDLATTLAASETVSAVGPFATPVVEGYLTGFDNYEVKAFSEGAIFAPMIGTIPFVAYVFTVADGVDAVNFASELEANCNPRWNICTAAEETVTEVVGNKVFFVMCPMSFDTADESVGEAGIGDMDMEISEETPAYNG